MHSQNVFHPLCFSSISMWWGESLFLVHSSHCVSIENWPFKEFTKMLAYYDSCFTDQGGITDQHQKAPAAENNKRSTMGRAKMVPKFLFAILLQTAFPLSYNQWAWLNHSCRSVTLLAIYEQIPWGHTPKQVLGRFLKWPQKQACWSPREGGLKLPWNSDSGNVPIVLQLGYH